MSKAVKIHIKAKDAAYMDVVKTINRMMFDKRQEPNYLGCRVWMRDESRTDEEAVKFIHVDLGFENALPENVDSIVNDIKSALSEIYDAVTDVDVKTTSYKSGQHEIKLDCICKETMSSEMRIAKRNNEERKKAEAERQEALRKQVEAERQQAELEARAKANERYVEQWCAKIAKSRTFEQLDAAFTEAMKNDQLTSDQIALIESWHDIAEDRITQGIPENDDSAYMRLKYEKQIANAMVSSDIERIAKFIRKNFDEGRMNNETLTYLNEKLNARRKELLVGDSSKDIKYNGFTIKNVKGHYEAFDGANHIVSGDTIEEVEKELDEFLQKEHIERLKELLRTGKAKLRDVDVGYAVVRIAPNGQLNLNSPVERLFVDKDEALRNKESLEHTDSSYYFAVVNCNNGKYVKVYDAVHDVSPRKGETKQDFISRFMSATKEEYPDPKQRLAVAYSYWRKR